MSCKKMVLIGAGGHAKSVLSSIKSKTEYEVLGFVNPHKLNFEKLAYLGCDQDLTHIQENCNLAFIGIGSIGNVEIRKKLYQKLREIGFELVNICDKSSCIASKLTKNGIFVGKKAIINVGCEIGNMCIINTGAIIEHDCKIGDFVHIAPGAVICGEVKIGNNSHIGAGSVVRQGITIGENVIVGVGSVVVSDLPDNVVAFGNPCRVREKK